MSLKPKDKQTTLNIRLGASQVSLVVKNLPANAGDIWDAYLIPGPGLGRSPGGGHGSHSSRIPGTEEPDGLQSIGLQRVGYNWKDLFSMHSIRLNVYTLAGVCS